MDTFGSLIAGALVVAAIITGLLLLSSKAVLVWEERVIGYGYNCWYFTGTRVIENGNTSYTGCKRFIGVGE